MERNGIRDPGFQVEAAMTRLEGVLRQQGVATAGDNPFGLPLLDHLEQVHGATTPLADCSACGLLMAYSYMTEFLGSLKHAEPYLALAEAARKAAKHVRAAQRELAPAWEAFEPIAADAKEECERCPEMDLDPEDAVLFQSAPIALDGLKRVEAELDSLASVNNQVLDTQLSQPLGVKPRAQLLLEVEKALHSAGLGDQQVAEVTQGRADRGEIGRVRARRSEDKKSR